MSRNAKSYGTQPAIITDDKSLSWAELWQHVQAAAVVLSDHLPEDRQAVVALLAPNSLEFIVAYLATLHLGHITLPLDPAYKQLELDAIIDQVPSELIIVSDGYKDKINDHHEPVIIADELLKVPGQLVPEKLLRLPAAEQIASLTFTSGTTGSPKAVPNTHANHIWNIEVCSERWGWTHDDALLSSVPLSHMLGIVMCLSGILYHGNTLYLQEWFDEQRTLQMLSSGKISFFSHAASAYVKLLQATDESFDLSKVRLCVSGAAPLPPAVWRQFKSRFGIEIVETYGTSETGRIAGNELGQRLPGSPGKPFKGVSLRSNSDGEIEIKSGGVFPGYYQNSKETRKSLTADGYWKTGDLGYMKDGYVFLKGRTQERIRRFGYSLSPRDVEWALLKHPGIKDAYVMGVQAVGEPDDELVYFVVGEISDEGIRRFCKENLVFVWRPTRIIRLQSLPRTRSGKVEIPKLKKIMINSKG